jgi:anti-anti-sigma regulatory factor
MTAAMPGAPALPQELTIFTVGDCHALYQGWLTSDSGSETLALDASAVAEVDGAGVQLLLSLANSLAPHGRRLALADPSPPLAAACTNLGAAGLLAPAPSPETAA